MYLEKIVSSFLKNRTTCITTGLIRRFESRVSGMTEDKLTIDSIEVNCLQTGEGSHKVLCLPGSLGSIWTDFSPQIIGFDLKKFSLIVWDPPGYGKSRPPDRDFSFGYLHRDADLAYKLLQKLQINDCSLLGWSDGGITALILAAKYPHVIKKLVVWGANAFITDEDLDAYKKLINLDNWSVGMRNTMLNIYGKDGLEKLISNWVTAMIELKEKHNGEICQDLIPKINAPTMILHGAKDALVPALHYKFLHENIPNSKLHIFQDGKHNIHLKYAEFFNKIVQEFLLEKKK